jgi:hypothetical protein
MIILNVWEDTNMDIVQIYKAHFSCRVQTETKPYNFRKGRRSKGFREAPRVYVLCHGCADFTAEDPEKRLQILIEKSSTQLLKLLF